VRFPTSAEVRTVQRAADVWRVTKSAPRAPTVCASLDPEATITSVNLQQITKVYPNGFQALYELDLEIAEGEFIVLVGPSGCGKTTALRLVAGLEEITSGKLLFGDRVMNDVPPRDRDVAMVFQSYALYPHMTVADNIGYALKLRRIPRAEVARRVEETAEILGLTEWLNQKPSRLSGGQRQRVAMGRAIVREPAVFLMDEPLSNLDAKLRVQMRAEVLRIQRRIGVTTIYVTHDQTEAMTMGDRVAVLRDGHLQQVDRPQQLYDHPVNMFVAAFIGSPAMNLFEVTLSPDLKSLRLGTQTVLLSDGFADERLALRAFTSTPLVLGIRSEDFSLAHNGAPGAIDADVDLVEALGSDLLVHFQIDAKHVGTDDVIADEAATLPNVGLSVRGEGVARIEPRAKIGRGERIRLAIDTSRLYFFDPRTGASIAA
jgi:multiple sugar transport system ATP-binding protein